MKARSKALLLVGLLLTHAPFVVGQEDLNDADFQSLLDENQTPTSAPEVTSPPAENISSETVNLDELQPTETSSGIPDEQPVETSVSDPLPDSIQTVETPETLEPLPTPTTDPKDKPIEFSEVETGPEIDVNNPPKKIATPEKKPTEKTTDDLESIKADMGPEVAPEETAKTEAVPTNLVEKKPEEPEVFDVGREERELLALAQNIQGQISDPEWNEVATAAKAESYTVVKNDWLFKISKRIFGSGFYYPKIWSLNSFITNPHFIEPGMILSFTTGSGSSAPEFKLGTFSEDELKTTPGALGTGNGTDLANFGEDARPAWVDEKNDLEKQGVYFQYASEETMDDLTQAGADALNKEYENYEPPKSDFEVILPKNYDATGFDKNSKIYYSFKEGYFLSTFLSTNIVQDFGSITNGPDENIFFTKMDRAYVKFDETINALPGDKFSIYSSGGKVKHENSDREGYKYTIVGQIKLLRKIQDKWEVEFIEVSGTPQRGDRITAYTPKIERITRTYNSRMVEAAIMGTFEPMQTLLGYGNVVYLDRGRADGVEMGNVFEVFGFKDRLSKKNITNQPTYKLGELTVITLTDNFATVLVTNSIRDFYAGDLALTKTKEAHIRELRARETRGRDEKELMGGKALEELDVELNLENLNDDLLKQADKIQLTEDELAELERQEREKSVIKDSEKDLKALERLENEIEDAETILNDAKLDEDKLLENENLNDIEKKQGKIDENSLDEIEENLGKRYVDEDLNSKDNPYGLTEFDVEEVDELLNVEKKAPNNQ